MAAEGLQRVDVNVGEHESRSLPDFIGKLATRKHFLVVQGYVVILDQTQRDEDNKCKRLMH
jgi:hypothetical protein